MKQVYQVSKQLQEDIEYDLSRLEWENGEIIINGVRNLPYDKVQAIIEYYMCVAVEEYVRSKQRGKK